MVTNDPHGQRPNPILGELKLNEQFLPRRAVVSFASGSMSFCFVRRFVEDFKEVLGTKAPGILLLPGWLVQWRTGATIKRVS